MPPEELRRAPAKPFRVYSLAIGGLALASCAVLLIWDVVPDAFPGNAHVVLGAAPLCLIAVSYLVYQAYLKASPGALLRAIILVLAFLSWAENQALGDGRLSTLFNDLAIGLFVLDVFLTLRAD